MSNNIRLMLVVGFCGGFTTFSAFSVENLQLIREGNIVQFIVYSSSSVILGILATVFGMFIVKL